MKTFISIGRHTFREQEMVLDTPLAELIMKTCLHELQTAGLKPACILYLRSTNVEAHKQFNLPMHPFEHEQRLDSEVATIKHLFKDDANETNQEAVMIVRPFMGWTPAPRLRQLAETAQTYETPCISLLKQNAQQHVGWNMQVQDRSRLVNGALIWPQSMMFCQRPFKQEHPGFQKKLNWPKTFSGSQHLPDLQYFDETMLTVTPADYPAEGIADTLLQTARTVIYDEDSHSHRPMHELLDIFRLSHSIPCDLTAMKKFLQLYVNAQMGTDLTEGIHA
nr:hypothetical protein [uncultured Pseudodesulfovibrio sp.]